MLQHWLIDLIGHVSGLSDAQLRQIEKSLPATKALIDLLNRAQPIIEQAQSLYAEAEPLIEEAKKEWQTIGPAAQILIDVISHHVNEGSSPAEAAEAVRTALDGSIKSIAQDHWMDLEISCVTVFGGTGFVGRRVARHLRGSGAALDGSRNKLRNGVRRDWLCWPSRRPPFARVRRRSAHCLAASSAGRGRQPRTDRRQCARRALRRGRRCGCRRRCQRDQPLCRAWT